MAVTINVKHDLKRTLKSLNDQGKKAVPRAMNSAINRTATQVRTQAVRSLAKQTGFKQKAIRVNQFLRKGSIRDLTASLTTKGRASNLINFGARQTKKGVSAAPWGKRRIFKGTFIGNNGRTVFRRVGKKRLPIKAMYGPNLGKEADREPTRSVIAKTARQRWPINLREKLEFFLRRVR